MSPQQPVSPGNVRLARSAIVSPAELLKGFIDTYSNRSLVTAGAVVGGASDAQQQEGVVALMDAGDTKVELYVPILWKRIQVRCMGKDLDMADQIGSHIYDLLHDQGRLILPDSRENLWLVHEIYCTMGASHHIDSSETWESLLFANITIGRDPVGTPP